MAATFTPLLRMMDNKVQALLPRELLSCYKIFRALLTSTLAVAILKQVVILNSSSAHPSFYSSAGAFVVACLLVILETGIVHCQDYLQTFSALVGTSCFLTLVYTSAQHDELYSMEQHVFTALLGMVLTFLVNKSRIKIHSWYYSSIELGEINERTRLAWNKSKARYNDILMDVPQSCHKYEALDQQKNEFRLVELQSGLQYWEDRLLPISLVSGRLQQCSLSNPPPFVALSYECGDPSDVLPFLLDGEFVPITTNLWKALWELKKHNHTLVWVDCLCIDQTNIAEKSAQILRLNAIFREADLVVSWLGPAADDSDKVMQSMNTVPDQQDGYENAIDLGTTLLGCVEHFFARSYWSRSWVLQEIIAGASVQICCGQLMVPWEAIDRLLDTFVRCDATRSSQYKHILYLSNNRRLQADGGRPSTLLEVLHETANALSSDPNDKVYAVLSSAFDYQNYLSEPKYGLSPVELCTSMTRSVIRSKQDLDIILLGPKAATPFVQAGSTSRFTTCLPSWCPDYIKLSNYPFTCQMLRYTSGRDERTRFGIDARRWATTRASRPHTEGRWLDREILSVLGHHIGSIDSTSACPLKRERPRPDEETVNGTGAMAIQPMLAEVLFGVSADIHSTAGRRYRRNSGASALEKERVLFRQAGKVMAWITLNHKWNIGGITLTQHILDLLQAPHIDDLWSMKHFANVVSIARTLDEGVRLVTTSNGRVGWAHPHAQPRDQVTLVQGCSWPVVLRKREDRPQCYSVIGHAYIGGVMDGTYWDGLDKSKLETLELI